MCIKKLSLLLIKFINGLTKMMTFENVQFIQKHSWVGYIKRRYLWGTKGVMVFNQRKGTPLIINN